MSSANAPKLRVEAVFRGMRALEDVDVEEVERGIEEAADIRVRTVQKTPASVPGVPEMGAGIHAIIEDPQVELATLRNVARELERTGSGLLSGVEVINVNVWTPPGGGR